MSPRLALVLFLGLCVAEVALRVSEAINRAVTWACPACNTP